MISCQGKKTETMIEKSDSKHTNAVAETNLEKKSPLKEKVITEEEVKAVVPSGSNDGCHSDVCLDMRNHNLASNTFEIHMVNNIPVAGFQCDLPGITISKAIGGRLKENGFEASNSDSRILAFSMQGKVIPEGEGVLTIISYENPGNEVCMTEIIFAGIGGVKISNNTPECMDLK